MFDRPTLYFRRKDNGAAVYRIATGEHARLDLQQIAVLKQNGEVKPSGKQTPTEAELSEIAEWHDARKSEQKTRDAARVDRLIGDMNAERGQAAVDADRAQRGQRVRGARWTIRPRGVVGDEAESGHPRGAALPRR